MPALDAGLMMTAKAAMTDLRELSDIYWHRCIRTDEDIENARRDEAQSANLSATARADGGGIDIGASLRRASAGGRGWRKMGTTLVPENDSVTGNHGNTERYSEIITP